MEAAPRLPMIQFDLKICTENVSFSGPLRQYIQAFYNEDPESYSAEINKLQALRASAIRPTIDVAGCETLRKYYCQLHFLKSRFLMEDGQPAAVHFSWKDSHTNMHCTVPDIRFELMCVLYNIGALHTQLGAADSRTSPEGMKMACTHFQCAAWCFQTIKQTYSHMVAYITTMTFIHFMQQVCLAQAQECILEKSMLDNRNATCIAKVAVQVVDFYRVALTTMQSSQDETSMQELLGNKVVKDWTKYLQFKIAYHKCISYLFQGQQAEEQQKMGERVAFYQAACEHLEEARKLANSFKNQQEIAEALGFTLDVVEGKKKAAKNENEFIYHEEVPAKDALQEVKGASLVNGIAFNINDPEVSGTDIFARLVPMEAHEASSLYSEKKAEMIRQMGELVESKDQSLAEFMSSMQLEFLTKMHNASGIPQEIVDRAAAMSARPAATQDLVDAMAKLSNIFHEVESMLNEIDAYLKEEEKSEQEYQDVMGKRPPSIIATDLAREAAKYREAHNKANDSNQTLHRAMTAHAANLKVLSQPLRQLQQQLPSIDVKGNSNVDQGALLELEGLVSKVEEMRAQRAMLWAEFRDSVHKDDITGVLVTKQADGNLEQVFQQELQKHQKMADLIRQNAAAQENIKKALVESYAKSLNTRRYIQDIIQKRQTTINSLIASYDSYDDLLAKANKGIEFYSKLETNVTKLLQRIKGACKVQQEEREQMLSKSETPKVSKVEYSAPAPVPAPSATPKLKDYLDARKKAPSAVYPDQYPQVNYPVDPQSWPPGVRPAPLGSEVNEPLPKVNSQEVYNYGNMQYYNQNVPAGYTYPNADMYAQNPSYNPTDLRSQVTKSSYVAPNNTGYSVSSNAGYSVTSNAGYSITNNTPYSVSTNTAPVINNAASVANNTAPVANNTGYPASNNPPPQQTYQTPNNPSNIDQDLSNRMNNLLSSSKEQINQYQAQQYSYSNYIPQNYQSSYSYNTQPTATPSVEPQSYVYDPNKAYTSTTNSYQPISSHTPTNNNVGSFVPASEANNAYPGYNPSANYQTPTNTYPESYQTPTPTTATYDPQQYQYYNQQNSTYYPHGYAPGYTNPATQADYSNMGYHSNQYATSVKSEVKTNNSSTYSSPPAELASSNVARPDYMSTSTNQQPYNYNQAYQQYYPTDQQQNTYNAYNYYQPQTYPAAATSQPQPQPTPEVPPPKKSSNVDLLSGLDFTINQAPLVPQQNTPKPPDTVQKPTSPPPSPKTSTTTIPTTDKPKIPQVKILPSKPLNNEDVRKLFKQELDKYEKYVEVLPNKTLSGPTNLDLKWKEIQDAEGQKKIISVARCYPMKNRFPDILPYDACRVELTESKDDYINASYIKDVSPFAPLFILTQAPLAGTLVDFWTMVREQQVELIFCMLNDSEIGNDVYWPKEKGANLTVSNMVISLQSVIVKTNWTERLISISIPERRESWAVMHLQFTSWPGSLFPTTPDGFIDYVKELINLYQQQKSPTHPIVVHCSSGIGRAGMLPLLTAAILDVTNNATSVPDLAQLVMKLSNCQKNILRDREHLKFSYEAFLCYMKQVVDQDKMKTKLNEIKLSQQQIEQPTTEVKDVNVDPLSSLDPFWANK